MGRYLMNEWDAIRCTQHPDEVAFGGWFIDLHTPGGLLAATSEPASAEGYSETSEYATRSYAGPYGVPLRMLISRDIDNLMMAGRNVSATHCALATVRVMATTALMGQAAGVAAALAATRRVGVTDISDSAFGEVQQLLLRDGCFLPSVRNQDPKDKARSSRVSASSEAVFTGLTPESAGAHEGLAFWRDQAVPLREELTQRRGQWLALGGARPNKISFCLSNKSGTPQQVLVALMDVAHIWDYRVADDMKIAGGTLTVNPGEKQWVAWDVPAEASLPGEGYVRLDLSANDAVSWHVAGAIEAGHVSAFEMAPGKMRRYSSGVTMAMLVDPPQSSYAAANVLSGHTRPYAGTNLWRSDPAQAFPQTLDLRWDAPQEIKAVEVTFAGHLLREYHAYAPFYRDPQCVRDFDIQGKVDDKWVTLKEIRNNYQRLCKCQLAEPLQTSAVRLLILATNGDPSAAVYEVRVY
jgi:hypothetical protein